MKRFIVPLALLTMGGLLGAAAAWDCVRLAADARHRVELADAEMQKHELRLVKSFSGSPHVSPEVRAAVAAYQRAAGPPARHAAYDALIASFRQTTSGDVDPTNPLDRKFMDDVAGAINRRDIAQQPYEEELAAYQQFLNSRRGGVARWFSSQARADWRRGDGSTPAER